jgi:hypothetical protein
MAKMIKEITMECNQAIDYIINNVKINDQLELSYNRVFTPGEVLNVDTTEYHGKPGCKVLILVSEEIHTSTVEVDLEEIKDDLIEIHHIPKDTTKEEVIIEIDKCDV